MATGVTRLAALLSLAAVWARADWVVFRSGPMEVYTEASHREARQVLATFDQLHYMVAKLVGKETIEPLWPLRLVVLKADRSNARYRTARIKLRRDAYAGGLVEKEPIPADWLGEHAARLIREGTSPMPAAIEQGLAEMLSTLEAEGARIRLGTPPEASRRTRDWARMHLLCVTPEYAGRVRVFFANLQQGAGYDVAYRNSFERGAKEMEAMLDRYIQAGQFAAETFGGKPLNPDRDYRARPVLDKRYEVYLADLLDGQEARTAYLAVVNSGEKNAATFEGAGMFAEAAASGSESAAAWLAWGDELVKAKELEKAREAFRKAGQLNARWAEPHARLAAIEEKPGLRIGMLKRATELDPRNVQRWLKLAEAQLEFKDFEGASQSWRDAERAAPTEAERARIEAKRTSFERQRVEQEIAERRRQEEEKARELEQLKNDALARIRAAEERARAALGSRGGNEKVVEWWEDKTLKQSITGALDRVDCLKGPARLVLRTTDGKVVQLLISEPGKVVFTGGGELTLGCGPQKPSRRLKIEYVPKTDAKLGTIGEAALIEFLQ